MKKSLIILGLTVFVSAMISSCTVNRASSCAAYNDIDASLEQSK